jgi:hypothetical protein
MEKIPPSTEERIKAELRELTERTRQLREELRGMVANETHDLNRLRAQMPLRTRESLRARMTDNDDPDFSR